MVFRVLAEIVIVALLLAAAPSAIAQEPHLVEDIHGVVGSHDDPRDFVPLGSDRVAFLYGLSALAVSDGTSAGTKIVVHGSNPHIEASDLVPFIGGKAIYTLRQDDGGRQLVITDGTTLGTHAIASTYARADQVATLGDRGYFIAPHNVTHTCRLWSSDGTLTGTKPIADLPRGALTDCPTNLTILNSRFYFFGAAASFDSTTSGLWTSDGTTAGTRMLIPGNTYEATITNLGAKLLVSISAANLGRELWVVSDESATLVRDINAGEESSIAWREDIEVVDGVAYFAAAAAAAGFSPTTNLWRSDGTAAGTFRISDVPLDSDSQRPHELAVANGNLYFVAPGYTSSHNFMLEQVWRMDLQSGSATPMPWTTRRSLSGPPRLITVRGRELYFVDDGPLGKELWKIDTLTGQRVSLRGARPEPINPSPTGLRLIHDRLWYAATSLDSGTEPWVSDGTTAGTHELANLGPDGVASSNPRKIFAGNGTRAFFIATNSVAREGLWTSDGTENGTQLLVAPGNPLATIGPTLYFSSEGNTLWATDGVSIRSAVRQTSSFDTISATADGKLFISSDSSFEKSRCFDPASGRTEPISATGKMIHRGSPLWIVGDRFLYQSDCTDAGSKALSPLPGDPISPPAGTDVWMGGAAYRLAADSLYKSQGEPEGYSVVASDMTGTSGLIASPTRIFFFRSSWDELWVSDGTSAGTRLVRTLPGNYRSSSVILAGRLYFSTYLPTGNELWRSDGTPEGTVLVTGMNHGGIGGGESELKAADGYVYFSMVDPSRGQELWRADQNDAVTLVGDIAPGESSSNPSNFSTTQDLLFFSATTAEFGTELWSVDLDESPSISISDASTSEGQTAIATVSLSRPTTQPVVVTYSLEPRTATAGVDYPDLKGSIEFAPGETRKSLAIPTLHDDESEPYEAFTVLLASSARLHASAGTVLILPSDVPPIDIAVGLVPISRGEFAFRVMNKGPRAVTNVKFEAVCDPELMSLGLDACLAHSNDAPKRGCMIGALAPGAYRDIPARLYLPPEPNTERNRITVLVFDKEPDATPKDNRLDLTWTSGGIISNGFSTPVGGTSTAYVWRPATGNSLRLISSDPQIARVPEQVTIPDGQAWGEFTIAGGSTAGIATITASGSDNSTTTLTVTVSEPTSIVRLPSIVDVTQETRTAGDPIDVRVTIGSTSPGPPKPRGLVRMSRSGVEIARAELVDGSALLRTELPVGSPRVEVLYDGDENYLPAKPQLESLSVYEGTPTIFIATQGPVHAGQPARLTFRVIGGSLTAPTGAVTLRAGSETFGPAWLLKDAESAGATAEFTLPPLIEGTHVFEVAYSGDPIYTKASLLNVTVTVTNSLRMRGIRR